jgi:ribosomal protein S18 acetylase RimI-like enzyme
VRCREQSPGVIELHVLTPDDWARWRALRLAALADAPYAFGSRLEDWQGEGDREARWRARLEIRGSHNLLATIDGKQAGIASGIIGPLTDKVELISMWVSQDVRGRGVGDQLVRAVEQFARQVPVGTLQLAVAPGNEPAIALYHRNGLQHTGRLGEALADGQRERIMAKRLTSD